MQTTRWQASSLHVCAFVCTSVCVSHTTLWQAGWWGKNWAFDWNSMLSFEFPFRQRLNYSVSAWLQNVTWGGNKVRKEKMLFYTWGQSRSDEKDRLNGLDFASEHLLQSAVEAINTYVNKLVVTVWDSPDCVAALNLNCASKNWEQYITLWTASCFWLPI